MEGYTFSEADFHYLSVDDLKYMYHELRNMVIRKENITFALETIKRFVRRHIYYTYCYDFQLQLRSRHAESERQRFAAGDRLPRRDIIVMERALDVLDDRIEFRKGIRRFESLLGIKDNHVPLAAGRRGFECRVWTRGIVEMTSIWSWALFKSHSFGEIWIVN
ncbi:hypothetical protein L6452_37238 [Arctium lappa]|uniref:Uncharacterized protein n=1 Tax=Arctium lappa TaxID=4217 RepID=A0ACB8Y2E0_ARCLA|nr:hypothetical protein L6452_37238 [Arctium lappa]